MIVLDASVLANVVGDDAADGDTARAELAAAGAGAVPDVANVESMAVLRKRWTAGTLTDDRFTAAVDDLVALPVTRYPTLTLMRRTFELRHNVAVYDGCYVALAEALGCELVTADGRLASATGPTCTVRLLTVDPP